MRVATVVGHFSNGNAIHDGQTIKTRTIADELECRYGADEVARMDTHGGIRAFFLAPGFIKNAFRTSHNVMILPAQRGLRVFAPLCAYWKRKCPYVKLHYIVIGGWLPEFVRQHMTLLHCLQMFDAIYVETTAMKKALEIMGLKNTVIMPNCKKLNMLTEKEFGHGRRDSLKLCTFSRVMREKGIEDAVNAVREINSRYGRAVYSLDVFGQIDSSQSDWFEKLKSHFPSYVRYAGVIPHDQSVDVIKNYYALLFPTHYFTEGIPGTIIDAYAAGVPVICPKWENYADIIEDHTTGIVYGFDDEEGLREALCILAEEPERIYPMKRACLLQARKYTPENALKPLFQKMDG